MTEEQKSNQPKGIISIIFKLITLGGLLTIIFKALNKDKK